MGQNFYFKPTKLSNPAHSEKNSLKLNKIAKKSEILQNHKRKLNMKMHTDKGEGTKREMIQLERSIGLSAATMIIVGAIVGSGIYVSPKGKTVIQMYLSYFLPSMACNSYQIMML